MNKTRERLGELDAVAARDPKVLRFAGPMFERSGRRGLNALRVQGLENLEGLEGRPLVVFANHPSWWDPVVMWALHRRLFASREAYGLIDLDALQAYPFLARCGLFGVEKASHRGAARFMRQSLGVLSKPNRALWLTPQGDFADPRARPLKLKPGLARLLAKAPHAAALPLALEYPFWQERKPEALARFGAAVEGGGATEATLAGRLEAAMDELAQGAVAAKPEAFVTLFEGRAGAHPLYDAWRRLKAWATGRRFEASHARAVEAARRGRGEG